MKITLWPIKDPAERQLVKFHFTKDLRPGEIVTLVTVDITVKYGSDAFPYKVRDGSASIDAGVVSQWLVGGLSNTVYLVRCIVKLSSGRTLVIPAYLPVQTMA
jgi:hypothetical protein